jgi:PAS domain S-box-containing protein
MQNNGSWDSGTPPADGSIEARLTAVLDDLRRTRAEQKRLELMTKGLSGALREQADAHLETLDRLQQREEEALRRSEERFQRLLESAGEGIYGIDDEGAISFVNPAAARLIGAEGAGLLDQPLPVVLRHRHEDGVACRGAECPMQAPLRGEARSSGEATVETADGREIPVEYTSTQLRVADTIVGAVIVLRDVTERRRMDEHRGRVLQDLQASVAARDDFLSIASHELRTPLTPMRFQVHMLKRALAAGEPLAGEGIAKRIDGIEKQLDRLDQLIEQLLDVSRITVGRLEVHREPVDLPALVRDVIARMRPEFVGTGTRVSLHAPGRVVGQWDALRVEQVVTNLLSNAAKYGAGRPVAVTVGIDADRAVLSVRDHGIGISTADKRRIFDRFERLVSVRHYSGFGLGLWIVRQIVEAHNGTIDVESEPGQGATFTVTLPIEAPSPPPATSEPRSAAGAS